MDAVSDAVVVVNNARNVSDTWAVGNAGDVVSNDVMFVIKYVIVVSNAGMVVSKMWFVINAVIVVSNVGVVVSNDVIVVVLGWL